MSAQWIVLRALSLLALAGLFVLPFAFVKEDIGTGEFKAWCLTVWLLMIPLAAILFGFTSDSRAEFAERALEGGKIAPSDFARIMKDIHSTKGQMIVLAATSSGVVLGFFLAVIFPAKNLIEVSAAANAANLQITTQNAGFAVMVVSLFGLWLSGFGNGCASVLRSVMRQ